MVDFIEPIAKRDTNACQQLIAEQKKQLPDDLSDWEPSLVSMTKGINQYFQHEILLLLLQELPPEIKEALLTKILEHEELAIKSIPTLVDYINSINETHNETAVPLINKLLCSTLPISNQPEVQDLLLLLTAKQKGTLLTQLKIKKNDHALKKKNPEQRKLYEVFTANYEKLLLFLTIRASKTEATLMLYLSEDPILANLLVGKLLESPLNRDQEKNLIFNLLSEHQHYFWQDEQFFLSVQKKLFEFFADISLDELKRYFILYDAVLRNNNCSTHHVIRFLDGFYQTTKNIGRVILCIEAIDDEDFSLTINFLTQSKQQNRDLRYCCLKKMEPQQLTILYGHMLALRQLENNFDNLLFNDYIQLFCQKIESYSSAYTLLKRIAADTLFLPTGDKNLIIGTIMNKLTKPELKSLWLHALLKRSQSKFDVLSHCLDFIQCYPNNLSLILPLVKKLNSEELLNLYLLMVANESEKDAFNFLKVLFKNEDRHPQLFFLLSKTPTMHTELLKEFITDLDDKTLLTLIEDLLSKTTTKSEFKTTINSVLLVFCQRLYNTPNPDSHIHQWTGQICSSQLAEHLLNNPECVYQLSLAYSTVYSMLSWSSVSFALKHRIDAVFNTLELNQEQMHQIALRWLEHFRTNPEQLSTLLNYCSRSANNRTTKGEANLTGIKKECWALIKPNAPYQDKEFLSLISSAKKELFDPVLHHLAREECLRDDPYLGALSLAKTQSPIPCDMSDELLVNLLIHSVHKSTLSNWFKAELWLRDREQTKNLVFIQKLIEKAGSIQNNPILNRKTHQLIRHYPQSDELFTQLEEHHWLWFFKHANQRRPSQKPTHWFNLILEKKSVSPQSVGKIIAILPHDNFLIEILAKNPFFQSPPIMSQLLVQAAKANDSRFLICLYQSIIGRDKIWVDQFLKMTIQALLSINPSLSSIHAINTLIIEDWQNRSANHQEEKNLIDHYLQLLNRLTHQLSQNQHFHEIKQITMNLISLFTERDVLWAKFITTHSSFTSIVLSWLNHQELDNVTSLLSNSLSLEFEPKLIKHPLFQETIIAQLNKPPTSINTDRFVMLFELLVTENQKAFAKKIVSEELVHPVQQNTRSRLAQSLNPGELYELFKSSNHSASIAKELLLLPKGLPSLASQGKKELFDSLCSGSQVLELLASQTPIDTRILVVKELFEYFGNDDQRLSKKLAQWSVTSELIAALANFTLEKKHHELFNKIIVQKPYYLDLLYQYLHAPNLDIPLIPGSYLTQTARNNLLNPASTQPNNKHFLKSFATDDVFTSLKRQFSFNSHVQRLTCFFEVFAPGEEVITGLLHSARWQHRLLLLSSGLLEVFHHYTDVTTSQSDKEFIEQTALFRDCIKPLIIEPEPINFAKKLLSTLYTHLKEYHDTALTLDEKHLNPIKTIIERYEYQLSILKQTTMPELFLYIEPNSAFAPLTSPKNVKLTKESTKLLCQASKQLEESLKRNKKNPEHYFAQTLGDALEDGRLAKEDKINRWLLNTVLFSPLSNQLENKKLHTYLRKIPSNQLINYIQAFQKQQQSCNHSIETLHSLNHDLSLTEVLKILVSYDLHCLNQLIKDTELLNLGFLNELLSFAFYCRAFKLKPEQIKAFLLPKELSEHQDAEWLKQDLNVMQERMNHASTRLNQLCSFGLGYHQDKFNEARLDGLKHPGLASLPINIFSTCLNSYRSLFKKKNIQPQPFLYALNSILDGSENALQLLNCLDPTLIKGVIENALKHPSTFTRLIEKLINSKYSSDCVREIKDTLTKLLTADLQAEAVTVLDLPAKQLESLAPNYLAHALALQRLLFFANPLNDLSSFASNNDELGTQEEKQSFCADVSLYRALLDKQNTAEIPLEKSMHWLEHYGKKHIHFYEKQISALCSGQNVRYPGIQYSWLIWKAFITKEEAPLNHDLLSWLSKLDTQQLESAQDLSCLIKHAADTIGLAAVFKNAIAHGDDLTPSQKDFLCENGLKAVVNDKSLVPDIVKLSSLGWLEMHMYTGSEQNFELLKAGLQTREYTKKVTQDESNQTSFLSTLKEKKFTYQEILELIHLTSDKKVNSLLIIHLLSQPSYLNNFNGESILSRLTQGTHKPSRLNPLVHQLESSLLTPANIELLGPEAAVSLLCSIPHFHQLNEEQVHALLGRYPQPELIHYWINNVASMPNAHYVLAHLLKLASDHVNTALTQLDVFNRALIVTKIVEHLDLLHSVPKCLYTQSTEQHLTLAIRLFLNGHQHPSYITYINELSQKLLNQKHDFSLAAAQSLMSLNDIEAFSELNKKMSSQIKYLLRVKAQQGQTAQFYDQGHINFHCMIQPIQFSSSSTDILGVFRSLVGVPQQDNTEEHKAIEELRRLKKNITSFDYFLFHCKKSSPAIQQLITDYLGAYTLNEKKENPSKTMYHLAVLVTRTEVHESIRNAILDSFLLYPELFDVTISTQLLKVNATKVIQYFGMKGGKENYEQVINICTQALSKLDPGKNQNIIDIAQQAIKEAKFESKMLAGGFFTQLFGFIKRCWTLGWTGFFSPKEPLYVLPASAGKQVSEIVQNDILSPHKPAKKLTTLLTQIEKSPSVNTLDELKATLKTPSGFALLSSNEIELRQKIQTVFHQLMKKNTHDRQLNNWLDANKEIFIANQGRLLELLLEKNPIDAINSFKAMNQDNPYQSPVTQEFEGVLPELKPDGLVDNPVSKPDLRATATTLVKGITTTLAGFWGAAMSAAQTSSQTNGDTNATQPGL